MKMSGRTSGRTLRKSGTKEGEYSRSVARVLGNYFTTDDKNPKNEEEHRGKKNVEKGKAG